ncbi:MAG: polysaccharide pyruvyl transferase family protein [Nitrospiraceae bacterium]|nr:MAG: polysaccharide pyruvyl transferase family protein [Nitrospiraceae bacterium]
MKKIAIAGVTLSGNMGGQAMLLATLEAMRSRFPGASFSLLSIYPGSDRKINDIDDLTIVPAPAALLTGLYLPLALIAWPFMHVSGVRRILSCIPYFNAVLKSDMVIDLAGIAFVDNRGILLLLYNVACFLPAIILGKPVVKLSQALGPFEKPLNRIVSQFALSRCTRVVVRGEQSREKIKKLDLPNVTMLPDVAFAMDVPPSSVEQAKVLSASLKAGQKPLMISPSRVAQRQCAAAGINFTREMKSLIEKLRDRGQSVVLIAHSLASGASKNNDVALCHEILDGMDSRHQTDLITDVHDARILRALIGEAGIFVGCRFHSIVAALTMCVPCVVIGWSHKYAEMLSPFGLEEWVIDASTFSSSRLLDLIVHVQAKGPEISLQIQRVLPAIQKKAALNFDIAAGCLVRGNG